MNRLPVIFLVANLCCMTNAVSAHEFSAINVFLAYLKLSEPASLTPYISVFEKRFAPKVVGSQTEFTKLTTAGDAEKILAKNLAAFDPSEPFTISTSADFGEYDFEQHIFDFRPVSASSSFKSGAHFKDDGDINVVFINTKDFHGLPMEPAAAEGFVKKNGRRVYVDIEFVMVSAMEGSEKIRARLTRIDVYADQLHQKQLHTMTLPRS